jgi:probable phosphoglycerate mutase
VLNRVPFLYLRHGETDWNAAGLSQGNVDIRLNPTGVAQAAAAADLLRGRGIHAIVSSPLSRARDTAQMVAAALDLPVTTDADLREVAFGVQEGQPMADWFADWVAEKFTPEGGEPFTALRARAVAAVNRATARDGLVLIVGHGAFFRAVRAAAGLVANVRTHNAAPMRMDPPADGAGAWRLSLIEDAGPAA